MNVMILIDAKNFEQGFFSLCKRRNEFRYVDFYKINSFIMKYLRGNLQYNNVNLIHLRTYFYTGEYTDKLIEKIDKFKMNNLINEKLNILLEKAKRDKEKQNTFFRLSKDYYFFEIRSKPLQFSPSDIKINQKGVDVQLAVDLVDFTHKNIFDVAVILSGDVDLLESIKTSKSMGKQIIIFGENSTTAEEMKKYADLFIDINRFSSEQLDDFSHIFKIKKEKDLI